MTELTASFYPSTTSRGARLVWPQGTKLELGMSLRDAVEQLREFKAKYPLDVICDINQPMLADIVIDLPLDGLRLRFDPIQQRLRMLDIYNLQLTTLLHSGSSAFSGKIDSSFECIYRIFGPTYPGQLEKTQAKDQHLFNLRYPGLNFEFPVPEDKVKTYQQKGIAFNVLTELPPASRLLVHFGENLSDAQLPPLHAIGIPYMEKVQLNIFNDDSKDSSSKPTFSSTLESSRNSITFCRKSGEDVSIVLQQSTPQDVMSILGPPQKVFHSEGKNEKEEKKWGDTSGGEDYFYNYPEAGMDIQFNGSTHFVVKIHITSNLPGHPQFLEYDRCCFTINTGVKMLKSDSEIGTASSTKPSPPPPPPPPQTPKTADEESNVLQVSKESPCVDVSETQASTSQLSEETDIETLPPAASNETVPITSTNGSNSKSKKKKKGKGNGTSETPPSQEQNQSISPPSEPVTNVDNKEPQSKKATLNESKLSKQEVKGSVYDDEVRGVNTSVLSEMSCLSLNLTNQDDKKNLVASFQTPWHQLQSVIYSTTKTSGGAGGQSIEELAHQPVVHNNGAKNPFQSTEIYCGQPNCRALFEVSKSGFVCGVTLY